MKKMVMRSSGIVICVGLALLLWWMTRTRMVFAQSPKSKVLGTISGRVTLDNGKPAIGFTVTAIDAAFPFEKYNTHNPDHAITDANGDYTIDLLASASPTVYDGPINFNAKGYSVYVTNGGQPYVEPPAQNADPASQPGHKVTGLNFVMLLGPLIVVHAHDALTGAPDPGLNIQILNDASVPQTTGPEVTGPDGTVQWHESLTNFTLKINFPETLEAAPGYGFGSDVGKQMVALPGQTVVWDLKTYSTDIHIDSQGKRSWGPTDENDWHGMVLEPDGKPAAHADVTIQRTEPDESATLTTDAQGRFSALLPRMDTSELGNNSYFAQPVVMARKGQEVAAQVVTPDESWDGMTLRLAPAGSLTGSLTDPQGRPAPYVGISVTASLLGLTQSIPISPVVITDRQGHFALEGLPPGNYQLTAFGGGYGGLSVPTSVPASLKQPLPLTLALGQHRDLGALIVVRTNRTLAGTVVDTKGNPGSGLYVSVTGAHCHQTAATQKDGTFHVYDLADETLTLAVGIPGHEVTATVAPDQPRVHLVAPPDVIATNSKSTVPKPSPPPSGPLRVVPVSQSVPLDGLHLLICRVSGHYEHWDCVN